MLRLENVTVEYQTRTGFFTAIDNVSFTVNANEAFAIIGESGGGKTTVALSILGLLKNARRSGAAYFNGRNIFAEPYIRSIAGRHIGYICQNPYHAFDPVYKIGAQLAEALSAHLNLTGKEKRIRVAELLAMAELSPRTAELYPHELSGGMLQRAQLAIALCCEPALLIADEPTSALDVTIQAQLIDLLNKLRRDKKLTLLIITHDMGVVAKLADTAAVMKSGRIIEIRRLSGESHAAS